MIKGHLIEARFIQRQRKLGGLSTPANPDFELPNRTDKYFDTKSEAESCVIDLIDDAVYKADMFEFEDGYWVTLFHD